jgi:hypothetical protein
MLNEELDVSQAIKQEISRVIDVWANDLIKNKIATPQINPNNQRSLWDRVKGSLSNIWYGGRYNQNNPYYWKNRFGDDLGAKEESYNPRSFSLQEYKELKSLVDGAEKEISESIDPEVEKLKIVRTIRAAAEDLKQKLYDIFVRSCSAGSGEGAEAEAEKEPEVGATDKKDGSQQRPVHTPVSVPVDQEGENDASAAPSPPKNSSDEPKLVLPERKYQAWIPKLQNVGKGADELSDKHQLVDTILADDFDLKIFPDNLEDNVLDWLVALMHDAKIKKENNRVLERIQESIEKFKNLVSRKEK